MSMNFFQSNSKASNKFSSLSDPHLLSEIFMASIPNVMGNIPLTRLHYIHADLSRCESSTNPKSAL